MKLTLIAGILACVCLAGCDGTKQATGQMCYTDEKTGTQICVGSPPPPVPTPAPIVPVAVPVVVPNQTIEK